MLIVIAVSLLILAGGAYLLWLLAINLIVACILGAIGVALLVALSVLYVRNEMSESRKESRSRKLAKRAKEVKEKLEAEDDRRNGISPDHRAELIRENAQREALYAKMRRIDQLEQARRK